MKIIINGDPVEIPSGGNAGGGVPVGTIVIWSGTASNIPSGWALCNGQNGTPDLRGRFVLGGGGTHTVGSTGGEETHTLTIAEMPEHSHTSKKVGSSDVAKKWDTGDSTSLMMSAITKMSDTPSGSAGSSNPHNNMPPYYVLCYIMKL